MTRAALIERLLRQIYGGYVTDDSQITTNLVNNWLNDAIGLAAKQNYKESFQLEGVGYVNNSFYSRFSSISISYDSTNTYKLTLPEIPLGIGANEGISTLQLIDSKGNISRPLVPLSESQRSFYEGLRPVQNRTLYYYQGSTAYILSHIILTQYTARVTMVSGGDSTSLTSEVNVPPDYYPVMVEYIKQQLGFEKAQVQDLNNDGADFSK